MDFMQRMAVIFLVTEQPQQVPQITNSRYGVEDKLMVLGPIRQEQHQPHHHHKQNTLLNQRAWSWDTSFNWNPYGENVARQGNPSRWDPSMGNCKGLWFFDYQGIQNILNSGTAKSMRIYVKRETKGGGLYRSACLFLDT